MYWHYTMYVKRKKEKYKYTLYNVFKKKEKYKYTCS